MKVFPRAAVVLAVLLATVPSLHAQTTFRYRFKAGETLRYELSITTKGSTRAGDTEVSGVQKQNILMSWHVESVDDKGAAKIKLTFDRVNVTAEDAKSTIEVTSDSKEEPEKEQAKVMAAMAKGLAKFAGVFTMTPYGEVKDVSIPESALKAMRAVPGAEKMAEGWNDANLQTTLKDSVLGLPADPLTKGKSWKTKVDGGSPFGKLTGEVTFTYAGKADRAGRALDKFDIKPKLKIETDPKAKVPVTIKTYETAGTVYFDHDAGRLVESTTVQTIEVQAEVTGKAFNQKTEVTNTFKLVK